MESHLTPAPTGSRRGAPALLSAVTALLIGGYFAVVLWAWGSPTTDPQHGTAEGFLALVTLFLLGLAGLLWAGIRYRRRGLVWTVFALCAWPALMPVARVVYLLVRWFRAS
jgi:hypothetical protein